MPKLLFISRKLVSLKNIVFQFCLLLLTLTCSAPTSGSSTFLYPQAIINDLDWFPASEIPTRSIQQLAKAVGLVSIPLKNHRHCTAFLINEDVIMTNWHCFENASSVKGARLYLDYYTGRDRRSYRGTRSYNCEKHIWGNRLLDVALLQCQGSPGDHHGFLQLEANPPHENAYPIFLIHQNCNYVENSNCPATKKYSPGKVFLPSCPLSLHGPTIYHTGDTLSGSSGAPLFSQSTHKVIGLHHAGPGMSSIVNGEGEEEMNEAISMHLIVDLIKKELPHLKISY